MRCAPRHALEPCLERTPTDEILERAYCVPTSFALGGKAGVHSAIDPRAFAREHPTSLLGRVVAAIWPSDDA